MTTPPPRRPRPDGVFVSRVSTEDAVFPSRRAPARPQPPNERVERPVAERVRDVTHTVPAPITPVDLRPRRHDPRAEGSVERIEVAFGDVRARPRPPSLPPKGPTDPQERRAAAILDDLGRAGPGYEQISLERVRALGDYGIRALASAFPGLLWFDRRGPHHRVPKGRDVSPIASLLFQLYPASHASLVALLDSDDEDVRYYASLVCADLGKGELLEPMARRLFDTDKGIVRLALRFQHEVGGTARIAELGEELSLALSAFDAGWARRMRTIELLGALRSEAGLRALVAVLTLGDASLGDAARRSLRVLTAHDFGPRAADWQRFVETARTTARPAWLLDGLVAADAPLRDLAAEELFALTGTKGGYVPGCDARSAKAARAAFEHALRPR